jgi:hypothetical protein
MLTRVDCYSPSYAAARSSHGDRRIDPLQSASPTSLNRLTPSDRIECEDQASTHGIRNACACGCWLASLAGMVHEWATDAHVLIRSRWLLVA